MADYISEGRPNNHSHSSPQSDFVFASPLGGGDHSEGQEPDWVDPWTWLSSQGLLAGPGIGPGSEVLRYPHVCCI